ncbi:hypothetical protein [uncultured Brevibacillus sp.]|uniref:hypothetical protein n=1 Tax=uncultured Brevibacillus sp. TaxID=169970 RepID=UPI0025999BC3|nr:hypothetical protein [uncultured Brevibacillus sp.]
METINVMPKQGIGLIKLGMSKEEVEKCRQEYNAKFYRDNPSYEFFDGTFKVEYDTEGKVNFIELSSVKGEQEFTCTVLELDIFETKAEDLVEKIDIVSSYDRNDWELGYSYHFPELGLCFWRPVIFKDSDMEEEWFKAHDKENQESYLRDQYFRTVAVAVEGYWNKSK